MTLSEREQQVFENIANGKGHSVPYHFTDAEIQEYIARETQVATGYPPLVNYLKNGDPPWGILMKEKYGDVLVWRDAAKRLHVVDVTNMAIVASIKKAPFESPGSSVVTNMWQEFDKLFGRAVNLTQWIIVAALLILLIKWQTSK